MHPRWGSLSLHVEMASMRSDSPGESVHKDLRKAEEGLVFARVKALAPQTVSLMIHVTC